MTKFSFNKISLTPIFLVGGIGLLATLVPSAQAQQARVRGAAIIDDSSGLSAVAGEAILAPGQLLADTPMTVSPTILDLTGVPNSGADFTIGELDLDFTLDTGTTPLNSLEQEIAAAVSNANFEKISDVISLVEAFGSEVNSPQGQAQVTGAVAFDNDNFISAVAVQAALAPGQLLADNIGGESAINIDPSPSAGIAIDFDTLASTSRVLESEISDAIDAAFFVGNGTFDPATFSATESDVISLVNAFNLNQNGEVGQARITGAATFDDANRLSALASEAELAPGQGLDPTTVLGIITNPVASPALDANGAVAFIAGPAGPNNFLDQGTLEFTIDNSIQGSSLETAIANTLNAADFTAKADAISLVETFTSNNGGDAVVNIPNLPSNQLNINPLD